MLKWQKDINGYNGHWMGGYIGFDDDCPLYKVGEDGEGWYYEYLPGMDGMDGYDTAEEAIAAAEADFDAHQPKIEEEEGYTQEDLIDIHWDEVAHERMEQEKGLA